MAARADIGDTESVVRAVLAGVLPEDAEPLWDTPLREQGMDSLGATRLWFELKRHFGVELPPDRLGECSGVRELVELVASELGSGARNESEDTAAAMAAGGITDESDVALPLTPIQQSYLVAKEAGFGPDSLGCHLYREFTVENLDPRRLRSAWDRVVRRHEALRTAIGADGRQRVLDEPFPWDMPVHDMSGSDERSVHRRLREVRHSLSHRGFPVGDGPLFAIEVTHVPDGSSTVHFALDGLLTDGVGLGLLFEDWWNNYLGGAEETGAGETPRSEGEAPGLGECLDALRAERSGQRYREDLDYWTERLAELPPGPGLTRVSESQEPPADGPCPLRTPMSGSLDASDWAALCRAAQRAGASPTTYVLALFVEALYRNGGRSYCSLVLTTSFRGMLPHGSERTVGPFTSTTVLAVDASIGRSRAETARDIHRELWQDLAHSRVSGVEALRVARRQSPPVVFTSLLDSGAREPGSGGFADSVSYAVSQTTGVSLDHQMWEQDGALHYRWDVVPSDFEPGVVENLFALFGNILLDAASEQREGSVEHALNPLQQAYYVARCTDIGEAAGWNGCQVCHSFHVSEPDPERLESAWLRLAAAHRMLRGTVGSEGVVRTSSERPTRRHIPVLDTRGLADPAETVQLMREEMVARAYPLDRGPHSDLRLTIEADGSGTVHCALDLTLLDGPSIHFLLRELVRLYEDPTAAPRAHPSGETGTTSENPPPDAATRRSYWQQRVAELPPGPRVDPPAAGTSRRRVRYDGLLTGWRALRDRAAQAGLHGDDVLLTVFAEVLAERFDAPFTLPVVRWNPRSAPMRPGEFTELSWVARSADESVPAERARRYRLTVDEDVRHAGSDGLAGLGELRRRTMKERGGFELPVVYTGILRLGDSPLPSGVRPGHWLTCTPGVSLDCIAIEEGDELRFHWDVVLEDFAVETSGGTDDTPSVAELFERYRNRLRELAAGETEWWEGTRRTAAMTREAGCADVGGPEHVHRQDIGRDIGSAAEQRRLLLAGEGAVVPFSDSAPVHTLFEQHARQRPDATAVRWSGGVMTYGELNRRANGLARRLRELGVAAETPVGIHLARGPEMVVAVFGVLKAGGFYVPMDLSLPVERIEHLVEDTRLKYVLTDAERSDPALPPGLVPLDVTHVQPSEAGDPEPVADVDNTAYVIFTSGSSGRPKGVAVTHRPLLNLVDWCDRNWWFGPGDMGLCVTSLGFDLSVFDILGLLGSGAALYVTDDEQRRDPELLLELLLREPITFWNSAPTTLNQLAPLLPDARGSEGTSSLRLVFLSGDYTPLPLPDEIRAAFPGSVVVSLGGATEATVWSNFYVVGEVDPEWRSIPYGKPMDNAVYRVLDEELSPCRAEVAGDLYIGGECLSTGYHNRPALTAERFVPDPYGPPGSRLYRTGDRACWMSTGDLRFLGRADSQFKIRGFRVEPGEIEHRLREHDAVKDAVVVPGGAASSDERLVAFLRADVADPPGISGIRSHCAATLPDYMVPNQVVYLDSYPATGNGKLDRDRLLEMAEGRSGQQDETLASAGDASAGDASAGDASAGDASAGDASAGDSPPVELVGEIAETFAAYLDDTAIRPDEDLWDMGATSFTMVRVSGELRSRHGVRVPVAVLLENPTVNGIARWLAPRLAESPGTEQGETTAGTDDSSRTSSPPAPEEDGPEPVDFFSRESRDAFKSGEWNRRRPLPGEESVPLSRYGFAAQQFTWRSSHREFGERCLPLESFTRLLELLAHGSGAEGGRRLHPSAGDTYSVQVYLHVRPEAVEGLSGGLYHYEPYEHALWRISREQPLTRNEHFVHNRPLFDAAGFGIYLVGREDGIAPIYGADAERLLMLEAGYMGQLLMSGQARSGIGLCPIGTLSFEPLRSAFGLKSSDVYLHAMLGGPAEHPSTASDGSLPNYTAPAAEKSGQLAEPSAARETRGERADEVAVVGVAGRYPGAENPEQLWRNLLESRAAIRDVPSGRRATVLGEDAGTGGPPGGWLSNVDTFDGLLFRVSPAEARTLDPQLRLLLETCWECLEHAGHTPTSLHEEAGRVGVFTAGMWQDHQLTGAAAFAGGGNADISATASETANRISAAFDFRGPSVAVDTSCSAALTALHLACGSLRDGECDAALVAAVNLFTHPYHLGVLRRLGFTAEVRSPRAYDAEAAGWTPGEGAGAVLLRRSAEALRDGDTRLGVIEGTALGHTGSRSRFATPSAAAFEESLRAALHNAGREPFEIDYMECSASGAAFSDAAEVEAVSRVFGAAGSELPAGTVKPLIGHLEAASGISQLTKVLFQMRDRRLPPTPLAEHRSALPPWEESPLRFADRSLAWNSAVPDGTVRAVVNAVGATGSHGHVVLRSVPDEPHAPRPAKTGSSAGTVFVLSAQDEERLAEYARVTHRDLARRVETGTAPALRDAAHTSRRGRIALRHRLAVVCEDFDTLLEGLDAHASGRPHPRVVTGTATHGQEGEQANEGLAPGPVEPAHLARAWVAGAEVDWGALADGDSARRIVLPTYPFASKRLPDEPESAPTTDEVSTVVADAVRYLRSLFAEIAELDERSVDVHAPLEDYGLNSWLVTRLNERLVRDYGSGVARTLFFECRTLHGVATALAALGDAPRRADTATAPSRVLTPSSSDSGESDSGSFVPSDTSTEPVAIVGVAGRYPWADSPEEFWRNLCSGEDCVTSFPAERHREGWPSPETMRGGFLRDVAAFDAAVFGIVPRDAELMDPQERLFLEVTREALEDACCPPDLLHEWYSGRVGVFVGSMYNEYPYFGIEHAWRTGSPMPTGSALAGVANRVSHTWNLLGPSMTVDTMCSASLTALHLAVESLRRGECAAAITGGVNLSLHPNKFVQQSRLGMTSSDGRCHGFGAGGDGFVPGEGVGALLLKPLRTAVEDGDRVHAVIRGTAVNHGGRTNGYMVPDPAAQASVVRSALLRAGVEPETIGYIEAHGTGTPLGDPVEIEGLRAVFGDRDGDLGECPIGSVKSNIGHLEAAAGVAGLTKALLQLRHGRLVPSLHAETLNPNVNWSEVPFRVQRENAPWPARHDGVPRRAGVSSFGAGGANAHVVLEEYPRRLRDAGSAATEDEDRDRAVLLSARTPEALRRLAGRLAEWSCGAGHARLADVAHTLRVGREPMRERLGIVASDLSDLRASLERFRSGGRSDPDTGIFTGRTAARGESVPPELVGRDFDRATASEIAAHWSEGGLVDRTRNRNADGPRLLSLPTYPYESEHHWFPEAGSTATDRNAPGVDPVNAPGEAFTGSGTTEVPLYRRHWEPAPVESSEALPAARRVLCLYRDQVRPVAETLAELFGRVGTTVDLAREDTVDPAGPPGDYDGVVDLCDLRRPHRDRYWTNRLTVLRRLLDVPHRPLRRVMQVTSGLFGADGPPPNPAGARLAGFVRMLGAEYDGVRSEVFDTDADVDDPSTVAGDILREWSVAGGESEVRVRDGERSTPALRRWFPASEPVELDPTRSYLVSGGTSGIGAAVAEHLVRRGARSVALLGRRPLPPRERWDDPGLDSGTADTVNGILALERSGATVLVHTGSVTDRRSVADFLGRVRSESGSIAGVVHCAGVSSRGKPALVHKDLVDIDEVAEPKVEGFEVLAELCADDRPDFFVGFSSLSAVLPRLAVGMADYAAANTALDLLASVRARSGEPWHRTIDWPVWLESGSGAEYAGACEALGIGSVTDSEGMSVLDAVLAADSPGSVVVRPEVRKVSERSCGRDDSAGSVLGSVGTRDADNRHVSSARDRPSTVFHSPAEESGPRLPGWLAEVLSRRTGVPKDRLEPDETFSDMGVESVMLGELTSDIEGELGVPVDPALLFDHPTPGELAAKLREHVVASERSEDPADDGAVPHENGAVPHSAATAGAAPDPAASGESSDKVAIIGMSCRFPGAPDLDTFWTNLLASRCAVTEVPATRWDVSTLYDPFRRNGGSMSKWGGFVEDIEFFDAERFGLSDESAMSLDPAIRMWLEGTEHCLADAGYTADELAGRDIGTFAGARMSGYRTRARARGLSPGLGGDQNFIAAWAAHQYDLRGPTFVVDSACSSALVGLQLACRSVLSGESEAAFAGGVEVLLDEEPYLEFSAAGALSSRGVCATFDASADGFVPGEGMGMVLLKSLDAAVRDGDRVHAVIDAVAVGNDGNTMGLTTPNPEAQADVVRKALRRAGRNAREIGLIEAHGTATRIGDPIELRALSEVFRADTSDTGYCAIGSVKSSVGHLLSAAGMPGLIKAVLGVEHGTLPPTLFCREPNPRFDFGSSPFTPVTTPEQWSVGDGPRIAGISSFGLGGTNAHAVVSSFESPRGVRGERVRTPLPAPRFRRRRLWLDRDDGSARSVSNDESGTGTAPPPTAGENGAATDSGPGEASILRLRF
ncbi:hypothetical protein GCM10027444_33910 [Actinopolyspora lacussalsi]